MTHTTRQHGLTQPAPTAHPKPRGGARSCTIAFLHVFLPPVAPPAICAGRWTGSAAPAITVPVRLPTESLTVAVPVEHALPGEPL